MGLAANSIYPREKDRFEITHVPTSIRERDRRITGRNRREQEPVLRRYDRICFTRMRNTEVVARISEIPRRGAERAEITVEQVLRELAKIGFSDIRKAVAWRLCSFRRPSICPPRCWDQCGKFPDPRIKLLTCPGRAESCGATGEVNGARGAAMCGGANVPPPPPK
jgi:hypothetical protein